jgi:gliding motility-associated-like protein
LRSKLVYILLFIIGQLLSNDIVLGQTITMTGPATGRVCTSDNFSITVNSNTRIWFFLDVSEDLGITWNLDPTRETIGGSSPNFSSVIANNSISQTTRYRLRYTSVPPSDPNHSTSFTILPQTLDVTNYTTPFVNSISGITICGGTAFSVTPVDANNNPDVLRFIWTVATPNANLSGATDQSLSQSVVSQILTNTSITPQSISYSVTPITVNNCLGDPFSIDITVNPTPQIGTLTTPIICSDQTLSFTPVNVTNGIIPDGTTYTWTVVPNANVTGESDITSPQSSIGLSQTLRNTTTTLQTVVYNVTPISSLNCSGAIFTLNVPVNPRPYIDNKSYAICSNTARAFSPAVGDKIPTGTTYSWTVASNTNVEGQSDQTNQTTISQTLINKTTSQQTVVYTVTPRSPDGCDGPTFTITYIITPTPIITKKTPIVCSGGSFFIQPENGVNSDIVPPGTAYTWTVATNTNVTGQTNQSVGQLSISQSSLVNLTNTDQHLIYTVTSTTANGCDPTTFEIDVTVVPTAVIGPKNQTICSNTAFSVTPANGGGDIVLAGTRYTWTVVDNPNVTGDLNETTPQLSVSQTLINTTIVPQTVVYTATSNSTNGCASTNFTVTIVVNPSSQVANKLPAAICSGLSFSVLPINGENGDRVPVNTTYTWTVSVNTNITGQSDVNSGQSSISQTLTNVSASVQTLTYTVIPQSPGCTGSSFSITVEVNPRPSIGNKIPTAICSGSAFSVTPNTGSGELVPIGTTYSWLVSNNSNVTGQSNLTGQSSIGQALTNLSNTNQILTYAVTPISSLGCEGSSFTVSVTIKPSATIANKNLPICSETTFDGTPTNFTDIVPASTTYTWTVTNNSNITGANNTNAPQGTVGQLLTNTTSATQSVTYTVLPTLSNGCVASTFTVIVDVNPKPAIANITSLNGPAICSGSSFSVTPTDGTDKVPIGTKYTWTVSSSTFISGQSDVNIGQTSIGQLLNNLTNTNRSLIYFITPTTQPGCTGAVFQLPVTVKPTATVNNKSQIICSEAAFLLTPTNEGTDIIPSNTTYTWVHAANTNITGASTQNVGQTNITEPLTNLTSGIQTQTYIVMPVLENSCNAASFTASIIVKPKPRVANMVEIVCSMTPFSANPVDGFGTNLVPSNTLYTWIVGSNSNLSGQSEQTIPQVNIGQTLSNSTSITQPIFYTVSPSAEGCSGPQFTLRVDVKATPNITAYTREICSGNSFTVLPTNVGNIVPAGTTFTWNVVSNANINGYANQLTGLDRINQTLNNLKNTNQILNYNVTAKTIESCASNFNIEVTVKPTSVIANKMAAICTDNFFNVTPVNGTDIVPDGTTYSWTVLPNVSVNGEADQNTAVSTIRQLLSNTSPSVQTVNYSVSSFLNNGCTGGNFLANITVNPLPIVTINATSSSVCAGDALTLSGLGAQSYSWDNGISNGVSFIPSSTVLYTVTGTDLNGCINTASETVIVNPRPAVTVPTAIVDRCGTGAITLTATTDFGTVKWYDLITGGLELGIGNNLNIATISSSTSYFADALSSAGCYAITRKLVSAVVKEIPTISTTDNNFNCGPGSIVLKASPTAGVVNWYANSTGGPSISSGITYTTPNIVKTTTYYVDATNNNCTSLNRVAVVATVDTIPIITTTNPLPVCFPLTQDITNNANIVLANSAISYSYWNDISAISPISNPASIPASGTYYIKASDTYNCFDIKPVNVVINSLPPSPIVNAISYCQNDVAASLIAQPLLAHSLKWYDTNATGGVPSALANTPVTNIVGNQNFYVSQVNNLTSCESSRASLRVTTFALPNITISSSANPICFADSLTLTASGASSYLWDKGVINNAKFKIVASDRFTVIGTDLNGCKNTAYVDQVVNPLPIVQPLLGSIIVCQGANISLLNNVTVGRSPYQFTINSDSASVTSNTAGILFANKGGIANIYYNVKDAYGCVSENSAPFKIKVYDPVKPKIFFQEAFYDFNTIIKTKVDSGYSIYDWSPKMNLDFYNDKDPTFRGYSDVSYALFRKDTTSNCSVIDTYNITITTNFIFDLPNAFTPNSDGLNDVIKSIYNSGIASLNFLKIYNRKGNIVFQTTQLNAGWDGRVNGIDQESDAYYWTAEYVTKKSETLRRTGSFLLIK